MKGAEGLVPETRVPAAELVGAETKKRKSLGEILSLMGRVAFKGGAMGMTIVAAVGIYDVQTDINHNKAMLAHTHPTIIENSPAPPENIAVLPMPVEAYETLNAEDRLSVDQTRLLGNTAVVTFAGLGKMEVPESGRLMSPFNRYAANLSVDYDPNGIDTGTIAQQLDTFTDPSGEDIKNFVLYTNSAGSDIGIDSAVKLLESNPEVRITGVMVDSGALDLSVVEPESVSQGFAMIKWLDAIPDIEYSGDARVAAEMIMQRNKIHDIGSFVSLYNSVHDEQFSKKRSPNSALYADQFNAIRFSHFHDNLLKLGKLPEDQRPVIFFIGAKDPRRDDIVNVKKSYALLKQWTDEAGLTLIGPIGIDNFWHGEPEEAMEQYHQIFETTVIPNVIPNLDYGEKDTPVRY